MRKRKVVLILSFYFLVIAFGLHVDVHFSGEQFFSISLSGEADSCCEGPCDCCHNENFYLAFHSDFIPTKLVLLKSDFQFDKVLHPLIYSTSSLHRFYPYKPPYLFPDTPPLLFSGSEQVFFHQFRC